MAETAGVALGFPFGAGEAHADLLLEGNAAAGRVLHALDGDRADGVADRLEGGGERVHQEAGVDAGAEDGEVAAAGEDVEPGRDVWMAELRESELFAGRDDVEALAQRFFKLGCGVAQVGAGGVEEDAALGLGVEPGLGHGAADDQAVGRAFDDVGEGTVDEVVGDVHRADEFECGLGERGLGDGAADGSEALDDDGEGAGHGVLRSGERVSSDPR